MKKYNVILTDCAGASIFDLHTKAIANNEYKNIVITTNPQNEKIIFSSNNLADCKKEFKKYQ